MAYLLPFSLIILILIYNGCTSAASQPYYGAGADPSPQQHPLQWTRLTADNFTSDVRQHPFVLCIATVPWCGESRSVMTELLMSIEADFDLHSLLQLRVVYINLDKDLGVTLSGRRRTPTLIFYRHAISYRYKGKLKVHNILAGVRHGIATSSLDLPLKRLHSLSVLENFTESTDKAVILFDLCNWAQKYSQKQKQKQPKAHTKSKDTPLSSTAHEDVENNQRIIFDPLSCNHSEGCKKKSQGKAAGGQVVIASPVQSVVPDIDVREKTKSINLGEDEAVEQGSQKMEKSRILSSHARDVKDSEDSVSIVNLSDQQNPDDDNLAVRVTSLYGGSQEVKVSSAGSDLIRVGDIESVSSGAGNSSKNTVLSKRGLCDPTEYQQFEVFYRNLTKIARARVLTPERVNFGIVTNDTLISDLGLASKRNYSWFLMMQVSDRPFAPEFYFGDEGVDSFVSGSVQIVPELEGNYQSQLSNDTPSVILFIDRASPSLEVRRKSWGALKAIQAVARHYTNSEFLEPNDIVGGGGWQKPKQPREEGMDLIKNEIESQMQVHVLDSKELLKHLSSKSEPSSVRGSSRPLQGKEGNQLSNKELILKEGTNTQDMKVVLQILLGGDGKWQIEGSLAELLSENLDSLNPSSDSLSQKDVVAEVQKDDSLEDKKMVLGDISTDPEEEIQDSGGSYVLLEELSNQSAEGLISHSLTEDSSSGSEEEGSSGMHFSNDGVDRVQNLDDSDIPHLATKIVKDGKLIGENVLSGLEKKVGGSGLVENQFLKNDENMIDMQITETTLFSGNYNASGNELSKSHHENQDQPEDLLSFFFADGEDQFREMIALSPANPSVVILDPLQGDRYVFPGDHSISQSSLEEFVDRFIRGTLQKTYRSESTPLPPRKQLQPPFVNRDFHELNGVPRVTIDTFSQMVLGHDAMKNFAGLDLEQLFDRSKEELGLAWNKDVLVLFTAPWCGFCKRMELVFREVHRLLLKHLESYVGNRSSEPVHGEKQLVSELNMPFQHGQVLEELWVERSKMDGDDDLPVLLQMDCTANDCNHLLKGIHQDEVYPSIVLFPAEKKNFPVRFDGGPSVHEIQEFLAVHGSASAKILYSFQEHAWNKGRSVKSKTLNSCSATSAFPQSVQIDSTAGDVRPVYHFTADAANEVLPSRGNSLSQVAIDEREPQKTINYPTVGSVLVATDKLSKTSPIFENSIILIVKADGHEGFQGLIVNKPLSWKSLPGLDSQMEPMVNRTLLCYGGPVIMHGQPFVSLTRVKNLEGFSEVVPGVHFGGPAVTMNVFQSIKDTKMEATKFWFFLGHAVWSWQQLLDELAAHVWQLNTYREDLIGWPRWVNS